MNGDMCFQEVGIVPGRGQSVSLHQIALQMGGMLRAAVALVPVHGRPVDGFSAAAILLGYGRVLVHVTGPLCSLPPPRDMHEEW